MKATCAVLILGVLGTPVLALLGACDARTSDKAPDCPACECVCECNEDGPGTASADIGDLVATATRKLHHDDGAGCLADLDALAKLDPKMHARMAMLRGQCEMAAGQCQAGKERIAKWAEVETAVTPERAATTAEQLASMHCKGGDATDRDRLLAALFELSDGAYVNRRTPAFCAEHLGVARALSHKVTPTGPDDGQLAGGVQALFHTSASCFARAGDCKQALAVYLELFPTATMTGIPDATQRREVIAKSFDDAIVQCRGER